MAAARREPGTASAVGRPRPRRPGPRRRHLGRIARGPGMAPPRAQEGPRAQPASMSRAYLMPRHKSARQDAASFGHLDRPRPAVALSPSDYGALVQRSAERNSDAR